MGEVPLSTGPHISRQSQRSFREREFFIDNLLVRIHLIIQMILVDQPCAMGGWIPFSMQPIIYLPIKGASCLARPRRLPGLRVPAFGVWDLGFRVWDSGSGVEG